jgi:hypothetical protein
MALESARLYNVHMHWKLTLILIAGTGFCISSAGYLFVKIVMRPRPGSDWQETHWEFEEQDLSLARYLLWSKITFSAVIVSMLLLFTALSI